MILYYSLVILVVGIEEIWTNAQEVDIISILDYNFTPVKDIEIDVYQMENNLTNVQDMVTIQVYYECLCPDCRTFDTKQLRPSVQKLSQYLDIHLYPYGNAKTTEHDGHYQFECQHGTEECYGNKLHACAIDLLQNSSTSVFFNTCMMDYSQQGHGSDDAAAELCGNSMNINSEAIKECAKGDKGTQLLKYYGDESKKAGFKHVPYILINGVENDGEHFMRDVCAAFKNLPSECLT